MREVAGESDKMRVALDDVTASLEALVPVVLKLQAENAWLREALEELSTCVMRGWTEPAFARGKLQTRAVEIARGALSREDT
jgi:hypothetical protein